MRLLRRLAWIALITPFGTIAALADEPRPASATRNVVLVTTDGLRWQEVFRGADPALLNKNDGGVEDIEGLRREFWREDPEARRAALLPFFWTTIARQGQLFGNADKGSPAVVRNGKNFSYPGYNEMLTGAPDPRIDSNDQNPNPNVNVLEWLHGKPAYRGKVAAFGSWDTFAYILNRERAGLLVNAGWEPIEGDSLTEGQVLLNRLMMQSPRVWDESRHDAFTFQAALEHVRAAAPRVLYIAFGDTDEHAHAGRYDHYLHAAHHVDANLKLLWDELQAHPGYRGTTTLIVTTDHGRGDPPRGWRDHGADTQGSEAIWVAVIGPDTAPLGERTDTEAVTQSQVAATVAALLGEDFRSEAPSAAPPIADVLAREPSAASGRPAR
jgi:hypothetical protein